MRILLRVVFLFLIAFEGSTVFAASIVLNERDATVWLPVQLIAGKVDGIDAASLTLHCNNVLYTVNINADKTFTVNVTLTGIENKIWASYQTVTSGTLNLTLGYKPLPAVKPLAQIRNGSATLNALILDNPLNRSLTYLWTAAKNNPAGCTIADKNSQSSGVSIPETNGSYYFELLVIAGADSARFKTYIIRSATGLRAFDIEKDHAAWIDSSVIYEINPGVFVKNGTYNAITEKLGEIKKMGINTIWIQPVYGTNDYGGQGYSITDYFTVRADLGTEEQLTNLISTAKKLKMRVLFDFVPNHTAISHPYAQDCVKYGHNSHYYNFYQHSNDGKPYSSYYNKGANGLISYFWKGLVNLDYDNAEVQRWMIEAIKYWLIKYDLDGYRFDSMWGVNARTPQFSKKLNTELKSIKPDLLLLAEEKPSDNILYNNGFEAAYDWTRDTAWVSQWSWQVNYNPKKSLTIFNSAELSQRSVLLHNAIFQNTTSGRRLRFIENNDVPRFIAAHTPEQTRMAAALVFALPGIPLVYNGQEIGCKSLPYSARTIFTADRTIQQSDSLGLFLFYKKIIRLHLQYPALIASSINETPLLKSPNMLAFHRWKDNQHLIVIINLDSTPAKASLVYDKNMKQYLQGATSLHDLLTDTVFAIDTNNVLTMQIPMEGYGIRWLLVESKT